MLHDLKVQHLGSRLADAVSASRRLAVEAERSFYQLRCSWLLLFPAAAMIAIVMSDRRDTTCPQARRQRK